MCAIKLLLYHKKCNTQHIHSYVILSIYGVGHTSGRYDEGTKKVEPAICARNPFAKKLTWQVPARAVHFLASDSSAWINDTQADAYRKESPLPRPPCSLMFNSNALTKRLNYIRIENIPPLPHPFRISKL